VGVAKSREQGGKREGARTPVRADRREQLLEVASELFATRGYAATTMRDIAEAAGILAGSIYHHFSSKEALLDEILRTFLTRLYGRFAGVERQGGDPREALSNLIRISFSCIHDTPHAVAVYQNESDNLAGDEDFSYVADYGLRIEQIWLRVLTEGQTSGLVRPDFDVKIAYLFIRDAIWSSVRWYRPKGQLQPDNVADQYLNLLYGGLI
jgi:TetR/AcrR family transcriptional regulator, cholesterol catabolism regulator